MVITMFGMYSLARLCETELGAHSLVVSSQKGAYDKADIDNDCVFLSRLQCKRVELVCKGNGWRGQR